MTRTMSIMRPMIALIIMATRGREGEKRGKRRESEKRERENGIEEKAKERDTQIERERTDIFYNVYSGSSIML